MYTNRPDTCGSHAPFDGARHIWSRAAYERLVEAEGEDAIYHVETPVGGHYDRDLFTGGTVAKRVAREGDDWRGAASLQPVADLGYEDHLAFLASDEVCPSCRDAWLRERGLEGRPQVQRRLEG